MNFLLAAKIFNYYRKVLAIELNPAGQAKAYSDFEIDRDKPLIIYFGDSRIAQWETTPVIKDCMNLNYGISGQTTAQMQLRLRRDVLAWQPQVVVIQSGINDLKAIGVFPEQEQEIIQNCVNNIRTMIQEINSSGAKVILLEIIPPYRPDLLRRLVWSDRIEVAVQTVNEALKNLAGDSVRVVEVSFLAENGRMHQEYAKDCLHLNDAGYRALNEQLQPILQDLVSELHVK